MTQTITTKCISDFQVLNETPLQDAAHALLLQKLVHDSFFCLNYPRIRGWYQARVHPFSSGNGKGIFLL